MRTVTLPLIAAALGIAACSDAIGPRTPSPTSTSTSPRPAPSLVSDGSGGFAPGASDRVLFDARAGLQQATTMRQALALWGISADTRAGWAFTSDLDGAGTHALRVDWTGQATGCTTVTRVLGRTIATPKPKRLYAQWRQLLGRTATGGGLGDIGQFTVNRPDCASTYDRFVWMADRVGTARRAEVKWLGPGAASPAIHLKDVMTTSFRENQGWSFMPQEHAGEPLVQTVYLQAESVSGARDGIIRLWVNGRLFLEYTGLALGPEAFDEFHFPWKSVAPPTSQSEYFWDMVVWEPAAVTEPPPPPPTPAPVASVELTPPTATVEVGRTLQLTATLRDSTGTTLTGRSIIWGSSDAAVATVSAAGLVTALSAGSTNVIALSEGRSDTSAITVVSPPPTAGGPAPGAGDRMLFDTRAGLQQATTMRQALALWGISADTRAGWAFTSDLDGAGTKALRVDWTGQTTGCTSVTRVLGKPLPTPKPKRMYAQWRQLLGRTATGGGVGEIGQFTVNRPDCASTYDRFVWMADRDGSIRRAEVKWLGPAPASPAIHLKDVSATSFRANQGWSFVPQEHIGETIVQTVYVQAESAPGARDGVIRLWVNGQLFLEQTGLALGPEGFGEIHFPWKSVAPQTSQSEYFWDMVVWEPAAGPTEPPPPPPTAAPVASVTVSPATSNIEVGRTVQLTATLRDSTGTTLTGRAISWTSSNPNVAAISNAGLVTGLAAGTATLTATSENQNGTATVTVVAAPPPPPPPPPPPGLRAFPGAQGFGAMTPGGRGGTIVRVTNLNDAGPGSFRAALSVPGPAVIIFEVSGTINVGANLAVTQPFTTIAGQTAPSPGITLRGGTFSILTHDVVVQHLRFRPGDDPGATTERDGVSFYGGSQEKYNIVLDHCSISWGVDENLSTGTTSSGVRHDITFSNLIIAEGLNNSIHPEGPHSKGVLIGQGSKNIAFLGNLMAHHVDRNPWFKGNTTGVIVNNVIYNYGGSKATYFDDVDNTALQLASVVGNVYLRGVNSPTSLPIRIYSGVKPGSLFYISDNSWDRAAPPSNPWSLVLNEDGSSVVASTPPIWVPGLVAQPNANVEPWVLSNAGARPADRDAVDLRIVQEVRSGTGRIIDHPSDVGGWPVLAQNQRPLTTPANPNGDDDGDGYTNLEEWLHEMAAQVEGRTP